MFRWGIIFLVIALIAAAIGFKCLECPKACASQILYVDVIKR